MRRSTLLTVFTMALAASGALAQPDAPRGERPPREGERRVEIERRLELRDDAARPRGPQGREAGQHGRGEMEHRARAGRGQAAPGARAEKLKRFMAQRQQFRGGQGAVRPQGALQWRGQAAPGARAEMLKRFMAKRQQFRGGQGAVRPQGALQWRGQAAPGARAEMLKRFMAQRQQFRGGPGAARPQGALQWRGRAAPGARGELLQRFRAQPQQLQRGFQGRGFHDHGFQGRGFREHGFQGPRRGPGELRRPGQPL